jgi:hypothetical protein
MGPSNKERASSLEIPSTPQDLQFLAMRLLWGKGQPTDDGELNPGERIVEHEGLVERKPNRGCSPPPVYNSQSRRFMRHLLS